MTPEEMQQRQALIQQMLDGQAQQQATMGQDAEARFNRLNESGMLGGIRESPRNRGGSLNEGLGYLRSNEERIQRILDSHAGTRAEQMVMSDPSFAQNRANEWLGVEGQPQQGAQQPFQNNPFGPPKELMNRQEQPLDEAYGPPDALLRLGRQQQQAAPQANIDENNFVRNQAETIAWDPTPEPKGIIEKIMTGSNNFFAPMLDSGIQAFTGGNNQPVQNAANDLQTLVSMLLDKIR